VGTAHHESNAVGRAHPTKYGFPDYRPRTGKMCRATKNGRTLQSEFILIILSKNEL
jgi:hypothetical protein